MRRLLCSIGLVACGGVGDAQLRLRTAVNAKQDKLDACYTRSLTRDADGKGAMQLLLHVNQSDGVVDPVTVTSSEITDPKLAKCVRAALSAVQLSPAPGQDLDVAYTLEFGPEN